MKLFIKFFISLYTFLYKLTNGGIGGSLSGLNVLLLTTTGRKTGKVRTVPLGYIQDGSNYVIIASNGGQPTHPGWFFNVQSNPQVTLQLKDHVLKATAKVADEDTRKRLWAQVVQSAPAYKRYENNIREIPLVLLQAIE